MKSKIGIVISKDTSHSKVKIIDNKHKNKIIEVVTIEDITVGEKVYIEFKSTLKLKLIYIKYIQPIIFAILGSHGFSQVAAGTWGTFSSDVGDAHSKQEFV